MSTQSGVTLLSPEPIRVVDAPAKPCWLRTFERVCNSLRRRRQLQSLLDLDDRLLADVGLTREQAMMAARRTGWQMSIVRLEGDNR